ncbi:MAG: hypothetical protein ACKOHH_03415, partial [Bacteroidota bacterium]
MWSAYQGYSTFKQNRRTPSTVDSRRAEMLQFWSLWVEPQGQTAARSAVNGGLFCHAVLGGGLVNQGRPWTDEQTAGVMELF